MDNRIGSVKARLLVKMTGEPVELAEFEIPLSTSAAFGNGLGSIHVEEAELRKELANTLETVAKGLRDGR